MEKARFSIEYAKIYEEETLRLLDFQRQLAVEGLDRLANVGDFQDTNDAPASKRRKEFANISEVSVEHTFDQREDENGSFGRGKGLTSGKKRGRLRRKPLGDIDVNCPSFVSDERAHDEEGPRVEEGAKNEAELFQRAEGSSPHAMDATKVAATPATVAPTVSNLVSAVLKPVGSPPARMTRSRAKVLENGGATTPAMSVVPPAKRQRRRKCDSKAICDSDPVVNVRGTDDGVSQPTSLDTRVIADDLEDAACVGARSRQENESQSRQLSLAKVVPGGVAIQSGRSDAQVQEARGDEDGSVTDPCVVSSKLEDVGKAGTEEDRPLACSLHQNLVEISSNIVQPSERFGISSELAQFGSSPVPGEGDTREEESCGAARRLDECTDATNVEASTKSPIYSLPRKEFNDRSSEVEVQTDVRAEGGVEDHPEIVPGANALEMDLVSLQTLPDMERLNCRGGVSIQARSAGGQELLASTEPIISRHAQDRVEQLDVDAIAERQTAFEARRHVPESNDGACNVTEGTSQEALEKKHVDSAMSSAGANQSLPENLIEIVPAPPAEAKFIKAAHFNERESFPNLRSGLELREEHVQVSSGQEPPQRASDSAFVPVKHPEMCKKDVNVVHAAHAELNLVSTSETNQAEAPQRPPAVGPNSDVKEAVVSPWLDRTSAALNCEHEIPIPVTSGDKAAERASSPTGCVKLSGAVDGANEMDIQAEYSANTETESSHGRVHVTHSAAAPDLLEAAPAVSGRTCDSPRLKTEPKRMSSSILDTEEQQVPALPSKCTAAVQPITKGFDNNLSDRVVADSHEPDSYASLDEGRMLEKNQGDQNSHVISLSTRFSEERQSSVGVKTSSLENVDTCTKMRNSASGNDIQGHNAGLAVNMEASTTQVTPPIRFVRLEQTTGEISTGEKDCVQVGHFRTPCPRLDSFASFSASEMLASVSKQLSQKTDAVKPDLEGPDAERQTVQAPSATIAERDVSTSILQHHTREDVNSAANIRPEDPAATVVVNEASSHGELGKPSLELKLDDGPNGIAITAPQKHSICENDVGPVRKDEPKVCGDHVLPPSEREMSLCNNGVFASVENLQPVDHVAERTGGVVETSSPVVPLELAISRNSMEAEVQDFPELEFEPKTEWKRDRATGESVQSKLWSSAPRNGYPRKLASVLSPMMIETCRKAVRIVCKVSAERSGKVRLESSSHEPITPFSLLKAVEVMERSSPIPEVPETGVLVIASTPARSADFPAQVGSFRGTAQKPPPSIRKPSSVQKPPSSRKPSSTTKPSSNLVASLRSFVPIVQQAQPSFLPNAQRAVTVKALVAAEAAKLKQQKRDLERAKRKRLAEDMSQQNEKETENMIVRETGSIVESAEARKRKGDSSISGQQKKRRTGDRLPLREKSGVGDRVNSQARVIPAVGSLTQAADARSRIEKAKKLEEDVKKKEMRMEMRAKKYEEEYKKKGEELKRKETKYLAWKQAREQERQEREKKRQRLDNSLKLRRADEDQRSRAASGNSNKISARQPSSTKIMPSLSAVTTATWGDPNGKSTTRETSGLLQQHGANFATATTSVLHITANVGSDTATSCLESPAPAQKDENELGAPTSYVISPYVKSSDEEMEDDDEEDEGEDEKSQRRKETAKPIPLWALKENLLPHLQRQVDVNPDEIFLGAKTCTLTEIFSTTRNTRLKQGRRAAIYGI